MPPPRGSRPGAPATVTPVPVAAAPVPVGVVAVRVPVVTIVLEPLVTVLVKVLGLVAPEPPVGAAIAPPVIVVVSWLALSGRVAETTTPLAALASEAE